MTLLIILATLALSFGIICFKNERTIEGAFGMMVLGMTITCIVQWIINSMQTI